MSILFDLHTMEPPRTISSENPSDIFKNWQGENEHWMFVSAHDDDIVCGAGLTLLAAIRNNIRVSCVVTTNGRMGYCRPEHKDTIHLIRREEAKNSFKLLGVKEEDTYLFDYPDSGIGRFAGRQFSDDPNDPTVIAGATGLQNTYTWVIRKAKPTRVFLPVHTDLHPDHQVTHHEFLICFFHAQGNIWPELGEPIAWVPNLYEYATYSDYASPPDIRIRGDAELLEKKLEGISAYKSQEQIDLLVSGIRNGGPQEYVKEMRFDIIQPKKYNSMFNRSLPDTPSGTPKVSP